MSRVPEGSVVRAYRPSAMCEDDSLDGLPQDDGERQKRMRIYCRRAESRLPLFEPLMVAAPGSQPRAATMA